MSNEIARTTPAGLDMVSSLDDVQTLAKLLSGAGGGGFIPAHFKNPAQVAAVILAGRELGVPPMASLRSFFLIDGKLGMDQSFVLGRMIAAGVTHEWLRSDAECASLRLTRPGTPPYVSTFTKEDATRAGLWGRGPWAKYPAAMLKARAVTAGARAYAPDVFSGSVYTSEELRGGDHEESATAFERAPAVALEAHGEVQPPTPALPRILAAIDACNTDHEMKAVRRELVAPAWKSLTRDEQGEVTKVANETIARIGKATAELAARLASDDGGYITGGDESGEVPNV